MTDSPVAQERPARLAYLDQTITILETELADLSRSVARLVAAREELEAEIHRPQTPAEIPHDGRVVREGRATAVHQSTFKHWMMQMRRRAAGA